MCRIGFVFLLLISCAALAQKNVVLRAHYPFPNVQLANIGGYAANGKEYALVGTSNGLTIIDVSNPDVPVKLFDVEGVSSKWREVKTHQQYAYVTAQADTGGLQIIDLSNLPSSIKVKVWKGDSVIQGKLLNSHALHIDNGFLYLYGSKLCGGAVIASLKDPWNPHYVGEYCKFYIHDGYVRHDTIWAGFIYQGNFGVIDVSDKTSPELVAGHDTPGLYTHNTWLSDDSKTLFTTDEVTGSYLASYDVRDVTNIQELDRIRIEPSKNAIAHNTHILNDYAITSWYKEGIAITDVSHPDNMVMVGGYDTCPLDGDGYDGAWGVYPFLPSGNLLVSDMHEGLFVLTPTYKRACYLEGITRDSTTSLSLMDVRVEILGQPYQDQSRVDGTYKIGLADAGTYAVKYSKPGYQTRTLTGLTLQNGVTTTKNVKLLQGMDGIGELKATDNWNVYTDAHLQELTIHYELKAGMGAAYQFVLTDLLGKSITNLSTHATAGSISYSTASLPAGMYLLSLQQEGRIMSVRKVLLQ